MRSTWVFHSNFFLLISLSDYFPGIQRKSFALTTNVLILSWVVVSVNYLVIYKTALETDRQILHNRSAE